MSTKVVNKKYDNFTLYIGRPSVWANNIASTKPNKFGVPIVATKEEAIKLYRDWLLSLPIQERNNLLRTVKGQILGCYCCPKGGLTGADKPHICHGQVLAELADQLPPLEDGKIIL